MAGVGRGTFLIFSGLLELPQAPVELSLSGARPKAVVSALTVLASPEMTPAAFLRR